MKLIKLSYTSMINLEKGKQYMCLNHDFSTLVKSKLFSIDANASKLTPKTCIQKLHVELMYG